MERQGNNNRAAEVAGEEEGESVASPFQSTASFVMKKYICLFFFFFFCVAKKKKEKENVTFPQYLRRPSHKIMNVAGCVK